MLESCVFEFGVGDSNVIFCVSVFEISLYLVLGVGSKVEQCWRYFKSELFKSTVVDETPAERIA